MEKLNWEALLENKCPKCNDDLTYSEQLDKYVCGFFCDMEIKRTTVDKIVARLNEEEYEPEENEDFFNDIVEEVDNMGDNEIYGYQHVD